jgi:hypothetical protein
MTRNLIAQGLGTGATGGGGGLPIGGGANDTIRGAGIGETSRFISNPLGYFSSQLSNIIGFITLIGALFLLVYFLIAGFEWLQAGGDAGKADKAKSRMTNAAIGLLVMILATAIAGIIGGAFGIDILNPQAVFNNLIQ